MLLIMGTLSTARLTSPRARLCIHIYRGGESAALRMLAIMRYLCTLAAPLEFPARPRYSRLLPMMVRPTAFVRWGASLLLIASGVPFMRTGVHILSAASAGAGKALHLAEELQAA